jgi:hypothetical protein
MQQDKFRQTGISVSEKPAASIFRVENKMGATHHNRLFIKSSFNAHIMFLQTATHSKTNFNGTLSVYQEVWQLNLPSAVTKRKVFQNSGKIR